VRVSIALALAMMIGVFVAKAETTNDEAEIRALRAQSNDAIARHDIAAFMDFMDDDFLITRGSGAKTLSKDREAQDIASHFTEFPDVVYVRTPDTITLSSHLPLAMETGTWVGTMTAPDGPIEYRGSYSAGWRKTGNGWKIHSELFVTLSCDGAGCP
jgi:ketosteroid isomerase-like protein